MCVFGIPNDGVIWFERRHAERHVDRDAGRLFATNVDGVEQRLGPHRVANSGQRQRDNHAGGKRQHQRGDGNIDGNDRRSDRDCDD